MLNAKYEPVNKHTKLVLDFLTGGQAKRVKEIFVDIFIK
jgi:hypothetical protein